MSLPNLRLYRPIPSTSIIGSTTRPSGLQMRFSPRERKAISLGLITLGTVSLCFIIAALSLFFAKELLSVSDPLKDIRIAIRKFDKDAFFSRLSMEEQRKTASQVHFVSEIIDRTVNVPQSKELALAIVTESAKAQVDPLLVAAVIKSESTFRSNAISHKGARGLMQLLPATAKYTEQRIVSGNELPLRRSLHNADYSIKLGIAYLKHLEDLFFGNRELALIAYNWGPGNLKSALKNRSHIPEETKVYARKIIKNHKKWKEELHMNARNLQYLDITRIG